EKMGAIDTKFYIETGFWRPSESRSPARQDEKTGGTMNAIRFLAVGLVSAALGASVAKAADFAPKGATATLTVEYVYDSSGKTGDRTEAGEGKARRPGTVTVDLTAQAAAAYSGMHAMSAEGQAEASKKQASAKSAQKKLEPMAADMAKIATQCGDDEACIE